MKNFCEDLFFFLWRALALVSLVLGLGLEHSCPWPRECLYSERLSLALALASDFFVSLALASSLVSSTPPLVVTTKQNKPELKVSIDNNPIKQSHHIKYLDVLIDDNLNWKQQIKEQCSKVARESWALNN